VVASAANHVGIRPGCQTRNPTQAFVVIAFDSKEKAQSWADPPAIKEITSVRNKTTKSSSVIVEGFAN
jgi:uncharacterized protein (DUF1330 family)